MNKMFKNFLMLVAFAAVATLVQAANTKPEILQHELGGKKAMTSLSFTQTGPGAALATWTATGNGPFSYSLINDATGQRIASGVTGNNFVAFNGLTAGVTYKVTVGDVNILSAKLLMQ
jgi:hypothetical protein